MFWIDLCISVFAAHIFHDSVRCFKLKGGSFCSFAACLRFQPLIFQFSGQFDVISHNIYDRRWLTQSRWVIWQFQDLKVFNLCFLGDFWKALPISKETTFLIAHSFICKIILWSFYEGKFMSRMNKFYPAVENLILASKLKIDSWLKVEILSDINSSKMAQL